MMARITYIEHGGTEHTIEVKAGHSVMEGATQNNIRGIDADCGGACACATCHVYVDNAWTEKVGRSGALEESLLEFTDGAQNNSRLSCQITVTENLDGLVVRLPASQQR